VLVADQCAHCAPLQDIFEANTAESMADSLQAIMMAAFAAPDTPIMELPMMKDDEKTLILTKFQGPKDTSFFNTLPVHYQIEAVADKMPKQTALISHTGEEMTFQEYNEAANKLAHHLMELGVGPDVPVGMMVERGFDLLIGILAALKAGGAYLPLDPSYPEDRLAGMVQDASAPVVLVQRMNLERCKDMMAAAAATAPEGAPKEVKFVVVSRGVKWVTG
jgi:non-ribosomal peptide synthetase component F